MNTDEHLAALGRHAMAFAEICENLDPIRPVPTCPGWSVHDLAVHVGGLHRWASAIVTERIVAETWRTQLDIDYPGTTDPLGPWLRDGAALAVDALGSVAPDERVWSWGADQHARFWPRRMLFETVIHQVDAAEAAGSGAASVAIDESVAVDGIDETLENLPAASRMGADAGSAGTAGEMLGLDAATATWRIRFTKRGWLWDRGSADSSCVHGSAPALLLWLAGRPASVSVTGEPSLPTRWQAATSF